MKGIASTKGILLHGPSGCGKSALVTSISKSANLPLITLKPHEIFSKYLGDSEKSLRNLFSLARSNAPCILFLDFFEILAPRRKVSSEESGVEERVLSTLLNEMDGVCEISGGVVVIGATTRLEDIDDAFLRPGRFDQIVNVDLPNFGDRLEIISGVFDLWLSAKQCQTIAEGSQGWNCADIVSFKRYLYFKTVCNGLNVSDVDMEKQIDLFNTLI
jgi:transitional endoplasmic reticulum ATPase